MGHHEVVREALWHLDAQCEAIGWEQPAQLLFVFASDDDTYTFYPVPSWDEVLLRTGHPAEAMRVLEVLARHFPPPTTDLYGLILVTEGFMLRDDSWDGGAIRDHPDRVEVRMLTLVTRDGDRAMLTHERDGIPRLLEDTEAGTMAGRVPEQLPRLLQAIVRS